MEQARHDEPIDADEQHAAVDDDNEAALDDSAVLEILESSAPDRRNFEPLFGIRNAVLLGTVIWLAILTAAAAFFF